MATPRVTVLAAVALLAIAAVPAAAQFPGCSFPVSPTSVTVPGTGGTYRIHVNPEPFGGMCPWTVESGSSWITVMNIYRPVPGDGYFDIVVAPADPMYPFPRQGSALVNGVVRVSVLQDPVRAHPARFAEFAGDPGPDALVVDPSTGSWDIYARPYRAVPDVAWDRVAYGRGTGGFPVGATAYAADFNGDGQQDVLAYNAKTGAWARAINRGTTTSECTPACSDQRFDIRSGIWEPGWGVTILDLNGDGRSDVFLYDPTNGIWHSALMGAPADDFAYVSGLWGRGWSVYRARLNSDAFDDLFLYNANGAADPNSGRWYHVLSLGDGNFDYREGVPRWAGGWTVAPGDFDGDGLTEIFLYGHLGTGRWFLVDVPETAPSTEYAAYSSGLWAAGWSLTVGDFNGDGRDDLFLYNNTGAGSLAGHWFQAFSRGDGSFDYRPHDVVWAAGWSIQVSDLDDDGIDDLFMRLAGTGRWAKVLTRSWGVEYGYGDWGDNQVLVAPYRPMK
jgi:VCBS repeat protein/FG-GAP repeat protein